YNCPFRHLRLWPLPSVPNPAHRQRQRHTGSSSSTCLCPEILPAQEWQKQSVDREG
ncbi:hypothetical protein N656DRAFT_785057, partial [Canariomyces notabilis]